MRVLVTGGAGFVGSHTVDLLVAERHKVRVLDVLDPQVHGEARRRRPRFLADHIASGKVEFARADVRNRDAVAEALRGCDAVLHLAAAVGVAQSMYMPAHFVDVNATGTARLLDVLANDRHKVKKVVVASTMSLYGEGAYACPTHGFKAPRMRRAADLEEGHFEPRCEECGHDLDPRPTPEDKPADPTTVYAVSKKTQEELALVTGAAFGIPTVALRYFGIYGERQSLSNPYTGVAAIFTSRLLAGKRPPVFEDGKQSRDLVHARDVARANLLALTRPEGDGLALNVGTGRAVTIAEVATTIARVLGKDIAPEITGKWRPGDVRHCIADIAAIRRAYGFEPTVEFARGIEELVAWSRSEAPVDRTAVAMRELAKRRLVR